MNRDFYKVLFDSEDYTCFSDNVYGVKLYKANYKGPKADCEFFSINPFNKGTSRAKSNVSAFRNILVEIDQDENGNVIPAEKQKSMMNNIGLPYATLVWSGGKSYHAIISVDEGFEDLAEYEQAVKAVYRVLAKNNITNDTQVKDPGRFSRAAGAVRMNTKQLQEVAEVKQRITRKQFDSWLNYHDEEVREPIYFTNDNPVGVSEASVQEKVDYIMKYRMKNMEYVQGNKNNYQFTYARLLRQTGLNQNEVESVFRQQFDKIDERGPIKRAYSSSYDNDEKIYVWTKEDKADWYRRQKAEERIELMAEDTMKMFEGKDNGPSVIDYEDWNINLANYIYVGNQIYKKDFHNPDILVPINDKTFRKFGFTNRDIETLPYYDGFTLSPDHLNYQQVVNNNRWNVYKRVDWQPVSGEWPTIKRLINHVYGANDVEEDQTDELYDFHTVMLKWPKQRQQARILYSHTQKTAKSTFAYLEQLIFQENFSSVEETHIETEFNSSWTDAILMHFDEPVFEKPHKISRWFRNHITKSKVKVRRMKQDHVDQDFYAKMLFTTNDSNFMPIEQGDRRYWIREVPKLPGEEEGDFIAKLEKEVNHYIYFLLNRELKYKKAEGVFWLPQKVITSTNGFRKLVGDNTNPVQTEVQEYLENYFIRNRGFESVTFTIKDLIERVQWPKGVKAPTAKYLAVVLRDGFKLEQPQKVRRLKKNENYIGDTIDGTSTTGRFWVAGREQFSANLDVFSDVSI